MSAATTAYLHYVSDHRFLSVRLHHTTFSSTSVGGQQSNHSNIRLYRV